MSHRDEPLEVEALGPLAEKGIQGTDEGGLEGGTQQQVVLGGHKVQGRAQERRPDDPTLLHEAGEIPALEVPQPRPQADVRRVWHLGLEADQALDGVGNGHRLAVQQHLPGERGPVELLKGQDAVCHGTSLPANASA